MAKRLKRRGSGMKGIAAAVFVLMVFAPMAQGATIDLLSGNVGASPIFNAALGPQGEWMIPNAPLTNGSALSSDFDFLDIAPTTGPAGLFDWNGNPLGADLSSGGRAHGVFLDGGELVLTGRLLNFGIEIFNGELLRGPISGFSVIEPIGGDNLLNTETAPVVFPQSGALVDNSLGFTMPGGYFMSFTIAEAQQNGGPLDDFGQDIVSIQSFQFNMVPVPEPATVVLLAGLAACVVVRRR